MADPRMVPDTRDFRTQPPTGTADTRGGAPAGAQPQADPTAPTRGPGAAPAESKAPTVARGPATGVQGAGDGPMERTRIQDMSTAVSPAAPPGGLPAIPGYEVLAEVGRGGMGVVYKARQLDLNRLVAVKMILGERYERTEDLVRFRLEAEMAARVRHPNVVQVYESGAWGGQPYLVLEWVEGGTLGTYLKGRPQAPAVCARTVELLARAMAAAHATGVVHRDLKPGNVLVARAGPSESAAAHAVSGLLSAATRRDTLSVTLLLDGRRVAVTPKITDFGLAKRVEGDSHLTETGRIMGTPEYMAPEQAEGRPAAIGPATDIYALGIILYQMLTGLTPFRGESTMAVLRQVVEAEPTPPRALQPKLPRDLETICLKCLQKEPARRYATAEGLADDLDCFLQGKPITARPAGLAERAWKWAARRPAVAALAATAALSLALGFAGVTWQWREAVAARNAAVRAEQVARDEKATADAVNHFLIQDLLETATPQKALGRQITVEEVLQNAAARVAGAFPGQPAVDASVRLALGNSYRKLGLYAEAAPHLRDGLALRQQHLGPAHRDTLAATADQALLLADESKWAEAIPLLRQTVVDARANLGGDDSVTLEALGRLALVLQEHGDTAEAEALFGEALDGCRRAFGAADPRTLTVLNDLGLLLQARKRLPEAERAFQEAADGRAKALSAKHPATLESLHNLAAVLKDQGRWQDAKPLFQQVLEAKRQVLGPRHADTLSAMNNLAHLLDQHGEYDAGLVLYEDALEGFRAAFGPENPLTLKVLANLGQLCYRLYRRDNRPALIDRAVNTLATVRDARRRVLPPDHPDTLQATINLSVALFYKGDRAAAEPLMVEALEGCRKVLGPGHPDTLKSADNFAQLLLNARQPALVPKATKLLAEAWAAAEAEKTDGHAHALGLLNTYVEALLLEKRRDDALPLAERAAAATAKTLGESAAATGRARRNLGGLLLDLNRAADAEPHLKAFYDHAQAEYGAADTRTARAAGKYGDCLLAQKKYAEAEDPLVLCFQKLRESSAVPKPVVRAAGEQLVKLYEEWGKPEKAAEWRDKLP
jgi:eukaryotic-like serine/threonine-protein kinase